MTLTPEIEAKLRAYATSLGFKPQEIQTLGADQRIVQMALKALAWDQLHSK